MSVEANKAIARRYVEEAWTNLDVLDEIMAEEITWSDATESRDHVKANWSRVRAGFPDSYHTVEWMVGEGDQVVVAWKWQATHTGEWMDIPPTNKEVEEFGWSWLQIADGKIVAIQAIVTTLYVLNQLGLSPSFKEIIEQAGGTVPD